MTHNKPSKEEGLFPLPFLFFVLCRAAHNMVMLQQGAEYGRNCTKTTGGRRLYQMKVTKNLKRRLEKAKQEGFKRVYVVLGNKFATTYCSVVDIDTLLDWPTGTHYWVPRPTGGRWKGWMNTRHLNTTTDIQYSMLFDQYFDEDKGRKEAEGA